MIRDERKALAADLRGRSGEDWAARSLCGQWTVRDVLAHMTSTASLTPPAFVAKLIGSGFSFDKLQERGVAAYRGSSPAETMSNFEAVLTSVKHPRARRTPGWARRSCTPRTSGGKLGIERRYPAEAVVRVADFYKGSNLLIGSKRRIAGLALRATDANWSHGSGPGISGPILSLVTYYYGTRGRDRLWSPI